MLVVANDDVDAPSSAREPSDQDKREDESGVFHPQILPSPQSYGKGNISLIGGIRRVESMGKEMRRGLRPGSRQVLRRGR